MCGCSNWSCRNVMARLRYRVDEMDRVVPVPACFNARLESVGRLRARTQLAEGGLDSTLRLGRPNLEPDKIGRKAFSSLCGNCHSVPCCGFESHTECFLASIAMAVMFLYLYDSS
jgi:hypothetical protein